MAAQTGQVHDVPQNEAQNLMMDDNSHPFCPPRRLRIIIRGQNRPVQPSIAQHSGDSYGVPSSIPAQGQPQGGSYADASVSASASASASGFVQDFGSSTSLWDASPGPSVLLAGRSQHVVGPGQAGSGAVAANPNPDYGVHHAASGNTDPNFMSTPTQTPHRIYAASFVFPNDSSAFSGPQFGEPFHLTPCSCPNLDQGRRHVVDNNNSQIFAVTQPQVNEPPPQPHPYPASSQALQSFYGQSLFASFQHQQPSLHQLGLNHDGEPNSPFVGFAPANDNNLPPACALAQPSPGQTVHLPQSAPVSHDYACVYQHTLPAALETEGSTQAGPRTSSLESWNEHVQTLSHGRFPDYSRYGGGCQEGHIAGAHVTGRQPSEDYTNNANIYSALLEDHDYIMPAQAPSPAPREAGASRKRPRALVSLDAGAGSSRQKLRSHSILSVASCAGAKVCKAPRQAPTAVWDLDDDVFLVKDGEDEKKMVDVVDMTADDSIPDELQIVPDPPSTKLSKFECIICLDTASTLTVTHCGHLFCGACLYQALTADSNKKVCPMCRQKLENRKWNVVPTKSAKTLFHLEIKLQQTKRQGKQPVRPPQQWI